MPELVTIQKEIQETADALQALQRKAARLEREQSEAEKNIKAAAATIEAKLGEAVSADQLLLFFKKPYVVIPQGRQKALVAVPKFVKDFQVGWLWKETETFLIYQLDQYSAWLSDVPKQLLDEVDIKRDFTATVDGDRLLFDPSDKDTIKKKLGRHIDDVGDTEARIVRGHAFDLLVDIIESGSLPFRPRPVAKADLREPRCSFKLRGYQNTAREEFLATGAVGVFYPTGAGKSLVALACADVIKGPKLVIVPTRTLVDQWLYYLETFAPHLKNEFRISTYQGYRVDDTEYALVVYDEAQRLPADTFSRLATVRTKYRMGLSASPHREDGRESYIFALTGKPIGLNWKEYMTTTGRKYHPINVHIVPNNGGRRGKIRKARELLDPKKRTFVFCDTIDFGKDLAREFNAPYIYGDTNNRLDEVKANRVCIVSRVMDLGVSVKDLEHIIEVDFLAGSRQQELQRTGRLMHSEAESTRHDIVMTEHEAQTYGKRLWALQEKGFTVKVFGGQ